MQTNKNLWNNIKKGTNFPTVLPIFALSQHFLRMSVPQWGTLTNVYLHPKKIKSNTNLFQRYVRSKNSQIYLAVSMPGASLFETSMLCLFVALSVWTKKNESHILIFLEDIADQRILKSLRKIACQGQDCSKLIYLFISLMTIQVQQKTTAIHSRNIEDERMLKSDWPRVT